MLLNLRMVGQQIQPVQFVLTGLGAERLAIERDQASDIAIPGFDNVLGVVARSILFAQKVAKGWLVLLRVDSMLDSAAHQGGGIQVRGLLGGCRANPSG